MKFRFVFVYHFWLRAYRRRRNFVKIKSEKLLWSDGQTYVWTLTPAFSGSI